MDNKEDIPPKAKIYIEMLKDIDYKIDEFIDLHLHGEIRNEVEKEEKSEFLKEELNREYINTEIVLERAREELNNAIESIKIIFANKLF